MEFDLSQFKLSSKDIAKGLKLPEHISPYIAYIVGVLAGDGNIFVRNDKKDYRVKCVGNPKDEIGGIEINGEKNFKLWMQKIGFFSPKHLKKIKRIAGSGVSEEHTSAHHLNH